VVAPGDPDHAEAVVQASLFVKLADWLTIFSPRGYREPAKQRHFDTHFAANSQNKIQKIQKYIKIYI
jgi:hypothetical protein